MLNPSYPGRTSAVKVQIVEMSLNGSGIRDIARVLRVSTRTVIGELKKQEGLKAVNEPLLQQIEPEQVQVEIVRVKLSAKDAGIESELDEMWSFVQKKGNGSGE